MIEGTPTGTRRAYLAGTAAAVGGAAGCLGRLGRAIERDEPSRVTVEVMTAPEDEALYSVRIANHLASNMDAAGINVDVMPTRMQNLLQDVLINRDFDIYIGRHPGHADPDFLYPLFHSRFAEEPGWQNPTSYTNTMADEMLAAQRQDPDNRGHVLTELQDLLLDEVPIIPIAFEEFYTALASEISMAGPAIPATDSLWLAGLAPSQTGADGSNQDESTVRLGTSDGRLTENLNPLSVDFRGLDGLTELVYEPLARWDGVEALPWLARSWEWLSPSGAAAPTIEVELRDGLRWHDSERITASDVAFTFRMLQDTTMSDSDPILPAPRFRGRGSLVDTIEAIDGQHVRIQLTETSRRLGVRALTLPILPEHIWDDRTGLTEIGGIEITEQTTDAVIVDNVPPVGSGPFECTNVQSDERMTFRRFPDHFLSLIGEQDPLESYRQFPGFDRLVVELRPSNRNIFEAIVDGELDGSLTNLGPTVERQVHERVPDEVEVVNEATTWLIHLGFNLRRIPFTMVGFRRAVAGLIDRAYLLDEVFEGGATPTASPIADDAYVPRELAWPAEGGIRFAGEPGTGEVDPEVARQRFRDAGFRYSGDGELLIQS